ncbi:hypothetical protein MTO96_036794 [Rhipicephalus appendiculatus]
MHGDNYEKLHEEIPPNTLPREYGGQGPQFDFDAFWRNVDTQEEVFASGNNFGYVVQENVNVPCVRRRPDVPMAHGIMIVPFGDKLWRSQHRRRIKRTKAEAC